MMKIIQQVLQPEDIRNRFGEIHGMGAIANIQDMDCVYRPFWLGRTDFDGKSGTDAVSGSVVSLADARVPRVGILGIWKHKIDTKYDLRNCGLEFTVVDREPEENMELIPPILNSQKVEKRVESPSLLKLIGRLRIHKVKLSTTRMSLVYRPYWKIYYKTKKSIDTALFAADGVLLRKFV